MKSIPSTRLSIARSGRFSPYPLPLPPRPSTTTARHGAHLRAVRLARTAALDNWLIENITADSTLPREQSIGSNEAVCYVYMVLFKSFDDGTIFQGPDTYCLSLTVEVAGSVCASPMTRLDRFVGSHHDADAPRWTQILQPCQLYNFTQPKAFVAQLISGQTDIHVESISTRDISSRMLDWVASITEDSALDARAVAAVTGLTTASCTVLDGPERQWVRGIRLRNV